MARTKKTKSGENCRRARDRQEDFVLIPLVTLVIVSVCGFLLIFPTTVSRLGFVLTRTMRERGIHCPPGYEGLASRINGCSADEPEMSSPSGPAELDVATAPEKPAPGQRPAPPAAKPSHEFPATRAETLANAAPAAHP